MITEELVIKFGSHGGIYESNLLAVAGRVAQREPTTKKLLFGYYLIRQIHQKRHIKRTMIIRGTPASAYESAYESSIFHPIKISGAIYLICFYYDILISL